MNMKTNLEIVIGIFMIVSLIAINKANDEIKTNEINLRNQLFSDIKLLRDGVDNLLINTEVLNKRFVHQVEILKTLQTNLLTDSSENKEDSCECVIGLFNSTYRKLNAFENRLVLKLEDINDVQTMRLDEILAKQKLNKNCSSKTTISPSNFEEVLTGVSNKIEKFEHKFAKLEKLGEQLSAQQNTLNNLVETQMSVLQEVNNKLTKNQELLEKYEKELPKIDDLRKQLLTAQRKPRHKLPMEVILGLTSSSSFNVTNFK